MNRKKAVVVGAGFAGISAATYLAKKNIDVTILEKNATPGGRARQFQENGFTYDMGPSWYWMPDVFESYFNDFGKKTEDYYQLERLDPSYQVFFGKQQATKVPADLNQVELLFESFEPGSSKKLKQFLKEASYKYEVGIKNLVYKPSLSLFEFLNFSLLRDLLRLDVFKSFSSHIKKYFTNSELLQLIEFPILFLGANAEKTPALYSLMNYADISLGTWYPNGGMYKIVEAMTQLALEHDVKFEYSGAVTSVEINKRTISIVNTTKNNFEVDYIICGADYHHFETEVLPKEYQSYTKSYWNSRTLAPSSLLFYLGINKKIEGLEHHNLFFDESLKEHSKEIYDTPKWPSKPLFYVSNPSKTDTTVAPEGCENIFILIPVAPGLEDKEAIREKYFEIVVSRIEKILNQDIKSHIIYKKSYAHSNFIEDYNSFKGNAYGLANTLRQTAILKPRLKSKKIKNLYYTGQLTVPGPGVPPSLISGKVVAKQVIKDIKRSNP